MKKIKVQAINVSGLGSVNWVKNFLFFYKNFFQKNFTEFYTNIENYLKLEVQSKITPLSNHIDDENAVIYCIGDLEGDLDMIYNWFVDKKFIRALESSSSKLFLGTNLLSPKKSKGSEVTRLIF